MTTVMTLREVCDTYGVSRRAVQGYEKAGLISASQKNERGYLLYDMTEQEQIRKIKFYQQIGFSLKEIKNLLSAPEDEVKKMLENQARKLEKENQQKEELIRKIYKLL